MLAASKRRRERSLIFFTGLYAIGECFDLEPFSEISYMHHISGQTFSFHHFYKCCCCVSTKLLKCNLAKPLLQNCQQSSFKRRNVNLFECILLGISRKRWRRRKNGESTPCSTGHHFWKSNLISSINCLYFEERKVESLPCYSFCSYTPNLSVPSSRIHSSCSYKLFKST